MAAFLASSNAVPLPKSLIAVHPIVWHPWWPGRWSTMSSGVCNWYAVDYAAGFLSRPVRPVHSDRINP